MKKFFLLMSLLIVFFIKQTHAQDEMGFDAKFGAGGGFTPMWIMPNLDAVNEKLPGFGTDKFTTSGFFGTGGTGYVSIPFIPNVRIGGMGFGGSITNESNINGLQKQAVYSASMGGFTIEYTLPFIKTVAISFGAIIGGASNSIELYQNKTQYDWNSLWQEVSTPSQNTQNVHRKLTNSHWLFAPTFNIDIPFQRFIAFRLGGGYKIAFSNSWEYDNSQALNNTPSNLNGNLLFLQAGIFIGFFNY